MKSEEFDIEKLKQSLGIKPDKLQPYDYNKYRSINPNLTEEAYEICWRNSWEWKIVSGKPIYNIYQLIVPPVWYLDSGDDIENRNYYYRSFFVENS
jgi:hypothetical protein